IDRAPAVAREEFSASRRWYEAARKDLDEADGVDRLVIDPAQYPDDTRLRLAFTRGQLLRRLGEVASAADDYESSVSSFLDAQRAARGLSTLISLGKNKRYESKWKAEADGLQKSIRDNLNVDRPKLERTRPPHKVVHQSHP